ncbi:glycoside hydrolase N-terminal domain-containing protein [Joostella atrarenae]|uniref:Glycoside hydrolase N-terminal domain-containing protein n=1 Tax=Joostella atrarenae TaxID=679257 RepID=A0ABS9J5C2_9FLAO|nr:glycoside hydrolase N-terminal domain-containing protein [Joostella atrarenae]MCF8715604.1 glycoside hydrolase N-terminal domain-containing protein [Joostella atrarenae]
MKGIIKVVLCSFLSLPIFLTAQDKSEENGTPDLWYGQPASKWIEALPVGNGRLGAMVFGGVETERIQLNEDSMWPGSANLDNAKGTPEDLKTLRKLIDDGKVHEADKFIIDKFSYKSIVRSHQTAGDLFLHFKREGSVTDYKRSLSFSDALAEVSYKINGETYTESVFSSNPDDILVVHLKTTNPKGMNFDIEMSRPKDEETETVVVTAPSDTEMKMNGKVTQLGGMFNETPHPIEDGVHFQTLLKAVSKTGNIKSEGNNLQVRGAKEITLYLATATSYYHENFESVVQNVIKKASSKSFKSLLSEHKKDFQKLYNRVDFSLGNSELNAQPTDKRLKNYKEGTPDLDLQTKLFQYGRYLLISSSREGANPANLQGLWNDHIKAPWNADYHLNINVQMNYWPATVTNLSECELPLFEFGNKVLERGKLTAKSQYGLNGMVAHSTTDLWAPAFMRAKTPYWGAWIHGGGWLAQHYWEYYQFTEDKEFLREMAYPYLKEAAAFYLDWLQWDKTTKKWISYPETSPENSYIAEDGESAAIVKGAAMGHQIIAEVFDNTLASAEVLGINDSFISEIKKKREKLSPGVVIGEDGRILEWNKPYEELEKGHRHMSHLYALYPGTVITSATPEAFKAAKETIDYRLKYGGAGTGWSRAWMISFNARLFDNKSAEENINKLFEKSTANNLFNEHPPFQIDGNFGYTAGVAELLLQSHEGFIRLLPTLPNNWKTGEISGLVARGDVEVAIKWAEGEMQQVGLLSKTSKTVSVKYKDLKKEIELPKGKQIWLNASLNSIK